MSDAERGGLGRLFAFDEPKNRCQNCGSFVTATYRRCSGKRVGGHWVVDGCSECTKQYANDITEVDRRD